MASQAGAHVKVEAMPQTPSSSRQSQIAESPVASIEHNRNDIVLRRRVERQSLITDEMGCEVVPLWIGPEQTPFNVHKNLICASSAIFADMLSDVSEGRKISLPLEDSTSFKLFLEFLYTKRMPEVSPTMTPNEQAFRIKFLCQMYAFAEKYHVKFEIRNKIMDNIQDGFLISGKLPEPLLVQAIYNHSNPQSKLRNFAVAGLYRWFRTAQVANNDIIKKVFQENLEIMDDFLILVRLMPPEADPRIRQCLGNEGCVECQEFGHERIQNLNGVWPCEFHVHKGPNSRIKAGRRGPPGTNTEVYQHDDSGCHLWDPFPTLEWLESHGMKFS